MSWNSYHHFTWQSADKKNIWYLWERFWEERDFLIEGGGKEKIMEGKNETKQHLMKRQEKKENEYLKEESIILADEKEFKERPFKELREIIINNLKSRLGVK